MEIACETADQIVRFPTSAGGNCSIIQNGESLVTDQPGKLFWKYFDSLIRILVAECTKSLVFLHAGAVGWRGKAIVLPGNSFFGKTSFVAELVRNGAVYYSDEYAIFNESGLVLPFARTLSLRSDGPSKFETPTTAEELGGVAGKEPIPLGCLFFTKFVPDSTLDYRVLSTGEGLMEIIPQTIGIKRNTEFALKVLKNALSDAIIVKSPRPDAGGFAREFLECVDNTAF